MYVRADSRHGISADLRKLRTNRMRKRHVRSDAVAEKCADAALRAIEELIGHDDVERRILLLEAADSAGGDDPLDAQQFEPEDIGAKVELGRKKAMPVA